MIEFFEVNEENGIVNFVVFIMIYEGLGLNKER